jgi:hypothetical protein
MNRGIPTLEEVRMHVLANSKDFETVKKALQLRAAGKLNGPMPLELAQLASQLAVAVLHHVMSTQTKRKGEPK